jgi:acetyl esterase/lipase
MPSRTRFLVASSVLVALCLAAAASGQTLPTGPDTEGLAQEQVVYATVGERELHMNLAWPTDRPREVLPAIVYIHGGAFRWGSHEGPEHLVTAQRGYFSANVEYRLTDGATWPAQIHDVKAAIRWLRAHAAEYGIDPDRIGAWGHSAGACLSMLLGTSGDVPELEGDLGETGVSARVQCVVSYFGLSDFIALVEQLPDQAKADSPAGLLFGGPVPEHEAEARLASAITHVSADDPPFLLLHGAKDVVLPYRQTEALYEALKAAGVEAEYELLPEAGHGGPGWDDPDLVARVERFWDDHLNDGRALRGE